MRAVSAGLALVILLLWTTFTSAAAVGIGIPCDNDGNNKLSEPELAANILSYLHGEGELVLEDVRDAAHVYVYWNGAPRTITDTADRPVTIYRPVKTIVALSSDSARAIRILGAEENVIGVSDTVQQFPFYFPLMSQQPVVGTWREVDWEAIVALEPDLVIAYASGAIDATQAAEKLEPFGISVVGLYLYVADDYNQIFEEFEKFAFLLEREDEAARFIAWHDAYLARVNECVTMSQRPTVFMTYTAGAIGKTTQINSYGPGSIDYLLCEKAGAQIITRDATTKYPKVDAEWIVTENPDIIVMKGGNVFGWWNDKAAPAKLVDQLVAGKSWHTVTASVNGQIYAVPWSITNGLEHTYGVVLLARIFHPELEIEPEAVYQEFLEEFLRVPYPEGEGKVLAYSGSTTLIT